MIRTAVLLVVSLVFTSAAQPTDQPKETPVALERKVHGGWKGGACMGDYTFNRDGTFEVQHFTPGNNTLTGTWSLRWDALPPTLVLTCKTSDFKMKDPSRQEYEYVGKTSEVKLIQLDDEILAYQHPDGHLVSYRRMKK